MGHGQLWEESTSAHLQPSFGTDVSFRFKLEEN
jgi:hypothetical protein